MDIQLELVKHGYYYYDYYYYLFVLFLFPSLFFFSSRSLATTMAGIQLGEAKSHGGW